MTIVWFLAAAVFGFLWWRNRHAAKDIERRRAQLQKEAAELWNDRAQEKERADKLSADCHRWAHAHEKATSERDQALQRLNRIKGLEQLENALDYSEQVRSKAAHELELAQSERRASQFAGNQFISEARARGEAILKNASLESAQLVASAEEQARKIAGDAYDLAKREGSLKKLIRSLENTINGYGDAYLLPTSALLDELQERYGFESAGANLKEARKRVAQMIKGGTAAACDYVEQNRRETAISFILDAFNGKVDSALSSVKSDNYGKLEAQIQDAYELVNYHGQAFRNARIEAEYLDAQLKVLHWSVAVQELRRIEKEEQRALREEIREEEKARQEYAKALKQAAREEEVARKAVAEAEKALLAATGAERQKYEGKLAELTQKLAEAEQRGQRAMSMAQQTKAGTVYVISNIGSFGEEVFKIGMTRRLEPEERVRELGDASVPFSFDIHALIRTDDAPSLEATLHRAFLQTQVNKVNPRKEFFRVPLQKIRSEIERMGIQAGWTMRAACTEWRETLALEEEMKAHEVTRKRWEEHQLEAEASFAEEATV